MSNASAPNQDEKTLGLIIWVGSIFTWFIVALVIYLTKKDSEFAQDQAKEALNLVIPAGLVSIVLSILAGIIPGVGFIFSIAGMLFGLAILVLCIMGAIAVNDGRAYRVPFPLPIRLIK